MSSRPPLSSLILAAASRERMAVRQGGAIFVGEFGGVGRPAQDEGRGEGGAGGGDRAARQHGTAGRVHRRFLCWHRQRRAGTEPRSAPARTTTGLRVVSVTGTRSGSAEVSTCLDATIVPADGEAGLARFIFAHLIAVRRDCGKPAF